MAKTPTRTYSPHFQAQLIFNVTSEVRQKLRAISYHMGEKNGMYSRPARLFIDQAVDAYIAGLNPHQREQFNEILKNVKIQEEIIKI